MSNTMYRKASLLIVMLAITLFLVACRSSDTTPEVVPDDKPVVGQDSGDPKKTAGDFEQMIFEPGSFDDPTSCAGCHGEIYEAWSGSKHSVAWTKEFFRTDYNLAHNETDGLTDTFCGGCHAPIALRTGLLPPHDGSKFDTVSEKGISCDFCHTVTEVVEPMNLRSISTPGKDKMGPRGDGSSPYHNVEFSDLHKQSEFCGACHTVRHPTTNVGLITTYDEWLETDYADQGVTCQKCHMTPTPGVGENPGKSSPMGPNRDSVATHHFVGGSAFSYKEMRSEVHAKQAEERLQSAAELKLDGKITDKGLELTTHVKNIGAGHHIPTGVSYIRKMWLEVTVMNEKGEVVYQSGHVEEGNHIDPDAIFFRKLFKDAEGNVSGKSWTAESVAYDRRIAHNETDSETYVISASGESYTAKVRLMYRSFSQESLNQDIGSKLQVESVEMAKAEIKL